MTVKVAIDGFGRIRRNVSHTLPGLAAIMQQEKV